MLPKTKSELKDYIKRKLGGDFIPLELSDNNMDDVISEAIVFFQKNYYQFSKDVLLTISRDDYIKDSNGDASGGVLQYNLPENVFSVMQVLNDRNFGNSGYWGEGTVPDDDTNLITSTYGSNSTFSHTQYVDIEILQQNFSLVESMFLKRSIWDYNHNTNILYLYSTSNDFNGTLSMVCNVFDDLNGEATTFKFFQDDMFLEYLELSASQQVYNNLRRYGTNDLPGGITQNIEDYRKVDEIKEFKERIIYNYCDPSIYGIFGENDF